MLLSIQWLVKISINQHDHLKTLWWTQETPATCYRQEEYNVQKKTTTEKLKPKPKKSLPPLKQYYLNCTVSLICFPKCFQMPGRLKELWSSPGLPAFVGNVSEITVAGLMGVNTVADGEQPRPAQQKGYSIGGKNLGQLAFHSPQWASFVVSRLHYRESTSRDSVVLKTNKMMSSHPLLRNDGVGVKKWLNVFCMSNRSGWLLTNFVEPHWLSATNEQSQGNDGWWQSTGRMENLSLGTDGHVATSSSLNCKARVLILTSAKLKHILEKERAVNRASARCCFVAFLWRIDFAPSRHKLGVSEISFSFVFEWLCQLCFECFFPPLGSLVLEKNHLYGD